MRRGRDMSSHVKDVISVSLTPSKKSDSLSFSHRFVQHKYTERYDYTFRNVQKEDQRKRNLGHKSLARLSLSPSICPSISCPFSLLSDDRVEQIFLDKTEINREIPFRERSRGRYQSPITVLSIVHVSGLRFPNCLRS